MQLVARRLGGGGRRLWSWGVGVGVPLVWALGCQSPNYGLTFKPPPVAAATGGAALGSDGSDTDGTVADASSDSGPNDGAVGGSGTTVATGAYPGDGGGSTSTTTGTGESSTGVVGFTEIRYEFTTMAYGGEYDPDHIVAVWVEQDGTFVRTLEVRADRRLEHLIAWRGVSGEDLTDAITSATIESHGTLSGTWDLIDSAGVLAADGAYTLKIELTADDSNDGAPAGPVFEVPIPVGGANFDQMLPGSAAVSNVRVWSQ